MKGLVTNDYLFSIAAMARDDYFDNHNPPGLDQDLLAVLVAINKIEGVATVASSIEAIRHRDCYELRIRCVVNNKGLERFFGVVDQINVIINNVPPTHYYRIFRKSFEVAIKEKMVGSAAVNVKGERAPTLELRAQFTTSNEFRDLQHLLLEALRTKP